MGKAHLENRDAKDAKAAIERATTLDPKNALAHFDCDYAWIRDAYRLLGYALRESGDSYKGQRDAWQNYMDRTEVEDEESREVRTLLIPLRHYGRGNRKGTD